MAAIRTARTYVQIGRGLEAFKEPFPVEEIPFMLMGAIGVLRLPFCNATEKGKARWLLSTDWG